MIDSRLDPDTPLEPALCIEPVDVAADEAGNVYVLDAGDGGQVSIHGSDWENSFKSFPFPTRWQTEAGEWTLTARAASGWL